MVHPPTVLRPTGLALIFLWLAGCGVPVETLPTASAALIKTTATIIQPTSTPQVDEKVTPTPDVAAPDQWTATADFGTFTFKTEAGTEIIIETFAFPDGFSCGESKFSGTSFDVFDISTTFPPANMFGSPPATPTVLIVKFPISGLDFVAGPFWIGLTIPTTKQRLPGMTMILEGRFDSEVEASGQYTADFVKNPTISPDLQGILCTGTFTAKKTSP
jgi:hypothetical protein